jgi:DNA-binding transcriptional regulator GbsR (MarR family)
VGMSLKPNKNKALTIHQQFHVCDQFAEFGELIGQFIEYWGFKKIHGQIWAHIFLSKNPIDATTMVNRLKVSKALVSLAIKDLLRYEVIQRVDQGSKRKILYQSNPDLIYVITEVLKKREKVMLETIVEKQKVLLKAASNGSSSQWICPDKLNEIGDMAQSASELLNCIIESHLNIPILK